MIEKPRFSLHSHLPPWYDWGVQQPRLIWRIAFTLLCLVSAIASTMFGAPAGLFITFAIAVILEIIGPMHSLRLAMVLAIASEFIHLSPATAADCSVSFRHDVMAVLSKAGCNAGACHGNQQGKGGFRLSLRGQTPDDDYQAITRDLGGRLIDPLAPEDGLILKKPTGRVPHLGGARFSPTSLEFQILRDWIRSGAADDVPTLAALAGLEVSPIDMLIDHPAAAVQITVHAKFSDGSDRDVTRLAVYEGLGDRVRIDDGGRVEFERPGEAVVIVRYLDQQAAVRLAQVPSGDFTWSDPPERNYIDHHIFARLRELHIQPTDVCGDETFVRRAFVDAMGLLPTADEARAFVNDPRPDKRNRLIEMLLVRPEFSDHFALKWSDLLRNEEKVLDNRGVQEYYDWIRRSIADGKPLDQFARELVTGLGSTYANPPSNYYRAMRDPIMRAESTAQLFLGIRLQCAKCHNHPYDRWSQDDYYRWAAVFGRIAYKIVDTNAKKNSDDPHEMVGEQIVVILDKMNDNDRKDANDTKGKKEQQQVVNPRTGRTAEPRLLDKYAAEVGDDEAGLKAMAKWLTEQGSRRFARVQANRIWSQVMGLGLVDPIDDFRDTNPPSHPELLDALAEDLQDCGYDLRHLIRRIMTSRVYQLSVAPHAERAADDRSFSHTVVRRLTAEQLLDAICQVTGTSAEFMGYSARHSKFKGYPAGMRAGQMPGVGATRTAARESSEADRFLRLFGKPSRLQACECERAADSSLAQVMQLISGSVLNDLLVSPNNRIGGLLESHRTNGDVIVELFWWALNRDPSQAELDGLVKFADSAADRRRAIEDVVWSLLNSKEFLLRH